MSIYNKEELKQVHNAKQINVMSNRAFKKTQPIRDYAKENNL